MTHKYEVNNQLTGLFEQVDTWEEAKQLQTRLLSEYMTQIAPLFAITILVQNEDGSWTQSLSDASGNPVTQADPSEVIIPDLFKC